MSLKLSESKPDKCRNCGHEALENYCPNCGQKTHLHQESFWHMAGHFVADYFHYDNKFLNTLNFLFLKPGYLARQHRDGKRARYLNPIQLYIFVSAVFFIFFASTFHVFVTSHKKSFNIEWIMAGIATHKDYNADTTYIDNYPLDSKQNLQKADSDWHYTSFEFSTEYLGIAGATAFMHYCYRHHIYNLGVGATMLANTYIHSIPKLFFVLMPWLAFLMLRLFFFRKDYFYIDYAVMSLQLHSFIFICLGCCMLLYYLPEIPFGLPLYLSLGISSLYFLLSCFGFYSGKGWLYTLGIGLLVWCLYLLSILVVSMLNLFLVMLIF